MNKKKSNNIFVASIAGYVIFVIPNILLSFFFGWYYFFEPQCNGDTGEIFIFVLSAGFLSFLWLKGFRLTLTDSFLEYRDGFYKISHINLKDILSINDQYVTVKCFLGDYQAPRLVIISKDKKIKIMINEKPFGIDAVQKLWTLEKQFKNKKGGPHSSDIKL